jgi:hypothetical protein
LIARLDPLTAKFKLGHSGALAAVARRSSPLEYSPWHSAISDKIHKNIEAIAKRVRDFGERVARGSAGVAAEKRDGGMTSSPGSLVVTVPLNAVPLIGS